MTFLAIGNAIEDIYLNIPRDSLCNKVGTTDSFVEDPNMSGNFLLFAVVGTTKCDNNT